MIVVALGLATALAYGASDFLGGTAARRAGASLGVVALLKLLAIGVFLVAVALRGAAPDAGALAWGAAAGVATSIAYVAYFHGLAAARMGVVATVTAVWAAVAPVIAGLIVGERPSAIAWIGIGAILTAIVLITYTRSEAGSGGEAAEPPELEAESLIHLAGAEPRIEAASEARRTPIARRIPPIAAGVVDATVAGIGFGMFFVAIDRAGAATGGAHLEWALLAATVTSAILVGALAATRRIDWQAARAQARSIIPAGLLYAAGSWAFAEAVSEGWISIVAVIAALSPAPTMALARIVLGERLSRRQGAGAILALAGVAIVTAALPG